MHRIDDAIVIGGEIVLSDLPFADGQHVQITVAKADDHAMTRSLIKDVRRLLKDGVERFDDPYEPVIPADSWDMLR